MRWRRAVVFVLTVVGVVGLAWLTVAGGNYEEDRQVGYLDGIRCEAVGRVYAPVWNGKYWEMGGEAWSNSSEPIDELVIVSSLVVNGLTTATDSDRRTDADHAETEVRQTWTNSWYEVCYNSTHQFRHRFTGGWKQKVFETGPCYASKEGQP